MQSLLPVGLCIESIVSHHVILGIPTYSTTFDHCNQKDKCHDTLDNANTRCLSDGFHAEVTGSQLLEIVSFGSAGHEPADDNENCMRSGKNKRQPAGN